MNVHRKVNVREAEQTAKSLLGMLGFREPETILSKYPFELSGGWRSGWYLGRYLGSFGRNLGKPGTSET